MAKKTTNSARRSPIRFDQFNKQIEEAGVEHLQEIEMSADESIFIRLGNGIDQDDQDEFEQRMEDAEDSEEVARIVLDYYPGKTSDEQWEIYTRLGGTADRLGIIYAAATNDQMQRMGKIRPRR